MVTGPVTGLDRPRDVLLSCLSKKVTVGIGITLEYQYCRGGRRIINITADKWLTITEGFFFFFAKLKTEKKNLMQCLCYYTLITTRGQQNSMNVNSCGMGLTSFYLLCRFPALTWPCSCSSSMERRLFSSGPPRTPCMALATWPRRWRPPHTPPEPRTPTNSTALYVTDPFYHSPFAAPNYHRLA